MKEVNLIPKGFSKKGRNYLVKKLEDTVYHHLIEDGKLPEKNLFGFFEEATQEHKGVVYFDEEDQRFFIRAYLESRTLRGYIRRIDFDFDDFEYYVYEEERGDEE